MASAEREELVVKVAFWNRKKEAKAPSQVDCLRGRCGHGCPDWDVLVLAEVRPGDISRFTELADGGQVASWTDHVEPTGRRPHGVMVIARTGTITEIRLPSTRPAPAPELDPELIDHVDKHLEDGSKPRSLVPERWMAVDLHLSGRDVTIAGFHAPYAAGQRLWDKTQNQLTKREAYRQVSLWAQGQVEAGHPVIVGMDGNNWGDWATGDEERPSKPVRRRNRYYRMLDEARLFREEHDFHGRAPRHRMRDTLRVAADEGHLAPGHRDPAGAPADGLPFGATYWLKDASYRMDRIYASPDLGVTAAGICHGDLDAEEVRALRKGSSPFCRSDHALVWADLDV